MSLRFEPDARLDANEPNRKNPDRDRAVELKALDVDVTGWADRAAAPAIGEERPALFAVDEFGVGLGPDQPAAERRIDRRHQQPVIAPGQAAGDRPGRIAAEPIGKPPLAALRLPEIAADRPAKADHIQGSLPVFASSPDDGVAIMPRVERQPGGFPP